MCKVAIIPAIKQEKRALAVPFIQELGKQISVGNQDGLGYAAIKDDGSLFGERWWLNAQAFHNLIPEKPKAPSIAGMFENVIKSVTGSTVSSTPTYYNKFGEGELIEAAAITLHTRFATSGKEFKNTHPFVDEAGDTSLIHNGVINNVSDFTFKLSTCDSEAILISYLEHGVNKNIGKVGDVAKSLYGYYVASLFSRDSAGNRILDIMKGNNDSLYASWVQELDTYVFCSSERDIKEVCNKFGYTMGDVISFKDGIIMRINPFTGEMLGDGSFDPNERYKTTYNYGHTKPSSYQGYQSNMGFVSQIESFRNKNKKKSLTEEEIAFMKLPPSITKVSTRHSWEGFTYYGGE